MIKNIKALSPLEKLYPEDEIPEGDFSSFSLLKNERKAFQVAVEAECECTLPVLVKGGIKGVSIYTVKQVRSEFPMPENDADDYYRFSKNGYYPDLLMPVNGDTVTLDEGINVLWIELDASYNAAGKYTAEVLVGEKSVDVSVEIIDAELDFGDFIYTNWFHTDCLMSYYKLDAFSNEYWRVTESFLKTARQHGMNCVLTPIFTPALDTAVGSERPTVQLVDVKNENGKYSFGFEKLTKWIETAYRCGVEYFELSHFFTQWGARCAPKIMATVNGEYKRLFGWETKANSKEYRKFLSAFSAELRKYLEEKGLKEKVLIHVSDEPSFSNMFSYGRASKYIHKLFEGYKIVDALSDYKFYKLKIVSTPIPANDHIHNFIGKVENLWVYYCSGQRKNYVSNRFLCNCSLRNRVLGYQLYKFDIKGFLHWGYNFYYTSLSRALINPFEETDAGKSFPSGDSFVVYPAPDGTAYHSLRLKAFYDGLQDMAALKTLEGLTDKNTCLDIIEEQGKHNITFRDYPHDEKWLLETREKVNECIKNSVKK